MMALVDGQRWWLSCAVGVLFVFGLTPSVSRIDDASAARLSIQEPLDRGLIARPLPDGSIYVSWRLLDSDPNNVAFHVYRRSGKAAPVRLTETPIRQTTDFLDRSAPRGQISSWFVRPVKQNHEEKASKEVTAIPGDNVQSYVSIPLQGKYTFQKVGIADLDGDGAYDFVIKQPNENIDPYEKYWKPSPNTYKLEAYSSQGAFLWRYDLGWSIERGIWYSPYIVYDLDGDGKAEVAVKTGEGDPRGPDGRVHTGPEYLTILDGATGKVRARIAWPSRKPYYDLHGEKGYNRASRNQLGVAYLDGKHPHLIVERGTYSLIVVIAYRLDGEKLHPVWRWTNTDLGRAYSGQGAHWMHSADVDRDGRAEVILGSAVLDDNGKALWSTGLGHPDHSYVGDLDPARPGLEIYYGIETRQKERNGMCLVDAATGRILWGHEGYTRHVHSHGLCSDIDARYSGSECYSADTDEQKKWAWARLRTCTGQVISEENLGGFGAPAILWDADPQRELLLKNRIVNYGGEAIPPQWQGSVAAVADVLGDWREELIASVPGELRIYSTTIPARSRHACLMQDPIYRIDVAHAAMGYYQVPMLSVDLASQMRQ